MTQKNRLEFEASGATMNPTGNQLMDAIRNRSAIVGIIGMGYVGLPLALAANRAGFPIIGFDVDSDKIEKLSRGEIYIEHLRDQGGEFLGKDAPFDATADFGRLGEVDVILICVPTPLTPQREPEMKYILQTADAIEKTLRPGQLILLESTTYPGTTDELLRDRLEKGGLRCGEDFFLAFSPEREDPGRKDYTTTTTPKVIGGVDPASGNLAEAFYSAFIERLVRVPSARTAEATKLMENIFRAVNIALVNELKIIYDRLDISIWDVLEAASTKPFGYMRFDPGPGWGGHCIPLDPFYLSWKAREVGFATRFIELAGEVNWRMPEFVVEKLMLALNDRGLALKGSRILILGIAYKKNIDDARESPAFEVIDRLSSLGCEISYHDPHIPVMPKTRKWPQLAGMESMPLNSSSLKNIDAVLLLTDHDGVDYDLLLDETRLIVDTRGMLRNKKGRAHVIEA